MIPEVGRPTLLWIMPRGPSANTRRNRVLQLHAWNMDASVSRRVWCEFAEGGVRMPSVSSALPGGQASKITRFDLHKPADLLRGCQRDDMCGTCNRLDKIPERTPFGRDFFNLEPMSEPTFIG